MQGHDGSKPDDGARDTITRGAGQQQARQAAPCLFPDHRCPQSYQQPGAVTQQSCDLDINFCMGRAIDRKPWKSLHIMLAEFYTWAKTDRPDISKVCLLHHWSTHIAQETSEPSRGLLCGR